MLLCLSQRPKTFLQNHKICRVFLCCRGGDLLDRKLRRRKTACGARKPSLWTNFSRKNRVPTTSLSKDIQLLRRIFTQNFSKIPTFRPVTFLPLGRFPPNSARRWPSYSPPRNSFPFCPSAQGTPPFRPFPNTNKHEIAKKDIKEHRKVLTFASEMRKFLLKEKIWSRSFSLRKS